MGALWPVAVAGGIANGEGNIWLSHPHNLVRTFFEPDPGSH